MKKDGMTKDEIAGELNLLSKINFRNNNDLMVYGFRGVTISIIIGVTVFGILSVFRNEIAVPLINSLFDVLKLFLTSVLLGCAVEYVKKTIVSHKKIIGLMAWVFIAYLIVDSLGRSVASSSTTAQQVHQTNSESSKVIDINKNGLIIKNSNNIIKYKLNKNIEIKVNKKHLVVKNKNSVNEYKLN